MIIKYNESKVTAEQAPRYAEVLSTYMGDGRCEQHELLLQFEALPVMEHGLTLAAYCTPASSDNPGGEIDEQRALVLRGTLSIQTVIRFAQEPIVRQGLGVVFDDDEAAVPSAAIEAVLELIE